MENTVELIPYESIKELIAKKQDEIDELRLEGVTRIENLKNESTNIKKNKQIDKDTKTTILEENNVKIAEAKVVRTEHAQEVKEKVAELDQIVKVNYASYIQEKKQENATKKQAYLEDYQTAVASENERYQVAYSELSDDDPQILKNKQKDCLLQHKNVLNDLKVAYRDKVNKDKDELHQLELEKFSAIELAHNRKLPFVENIKSRWENYLYSFTWRQFLLGNGLYVGIILLLIFAIIYYAIAEGSFLLGGNEILLILQQVSPKMFLALGVGGLIVLAGTDLSIGRLVGLASVLCCMFCTSNGVAFSANTNITVDMSSIPLGVRVVIGFVLAIVGCVVMTSIAGFFMARFKMHPFISTLATQLFTFGMLAGITGNAYTGTVDSGIQNWISGKPFGGNFSIMIIYAVIGIAVMWFIWNKTTLGKNMFAVGGNPEAAAVSGINVFWTTMAVFIIAGVYYGIGGSMWGIYSGNPRAATGQSFETDAISACVIGGVSFSGGVGKIRGIVIGAILLQMITVVLPYIGITDANYQLAIKGVIVLAAVALDCAKYLKKK